MVWPHETTSHFSIFISLLPGGEKPIDLKVSACIYRQEKQMIGKYTTDTGISKQITMVKLVSFCSGVFFKEGTALGHASSKKLMAS